MIVVKLQGGLGNQMFEYAFAKGMFAQTAIPYAFDLAGFDQLPGVTPRKLEINAFEAELPIASAKVIEQSRFRIIKDQEGFSPGIFELTQNADVYFDGYWQDERYFSHIAEEIRKTFLNIKNGLSPDASTLREEVTHVLSISLQIRRGDYVSNEKVARVIGACDIEYYRAALRYLLERDASSRIFAFSDDPLWVREHFGNDFPLTIVSRPSISTPEEILLMSACKNHIISNSSFAWWGAWLDSDPDKVVIAPKRWFKDTVLEKNNAIVPLPWIRM